MILAQFMVEQQFDKLRRMTGVQSASDPLLSNRLLNYKERSAKTLEYMIKNNEPVLTELKNELKLAEKLQEILGNIQLQAVPATNTAQTASNVHPEHPEHKLIQQPIDIPMQQPASQEMQATQAMQSRLPKPQAMPQLVKQSTPQATPVVKPKLNVNSATESDDDILDLDNSLELQGEFSTNPEDMKALSSFFGDDDI
jgi:hypothetical protein